MNRRRYLMLAVFSLAIVVAIGMIQILGGNAQSVRRVVTIIEELEGPYERVISRSNVPVLLPTKIPTINEFWITPGLIDEPDKYEFYVDLTEECDGAGACSKASFGGELITDDTLPVEEIYAHLNEPPSRPMPRSDEPMGPVELADDVTGVFVPWEAPAQCSEAKIFWEDGEYRYYVGIECAKRADLIEFANSVINNIPEKETSDNSEPE